MSLDISVKHFLVAPVPVIGNDPVHEPGKRPDIFIGSFITLVKDNKRKRKEIELAKLREQQRIQQENYKRIVATNVMLSSKF